MATTVRSENAEVEHDVWRERGRGGGGLKAATSGTGASVAPKARAGAAGAYNHNRPSQRREHYNNKKKMPTLLF